MVKTFLKAIALVALFSSGFAGAIPVTSLSGSTAYEFQKVYYNGSGPQTIAPGITWTSSHSDSLYGYDSSYYFGSNGFWQKGPSMIGANNADATMSISFDSAVFGVGAFLNYAPEETPSSISIYGANNTLLETFDLNFFVSGQNTGEFHGFQRDTADIFRFELTGGFIGATNLEVIKGVSVSEPSAILLMVLGLVGLVYCRRRVTH